MNSLALIRRSLRGLLRVPTFTAVCILTLTVGIAAATAIFSIVNGVLLTPLPYPEPERLVGLWHKAPKLGFDKLSLGHRQRLALHVEGDVRLAMLGLEPLPRCLVA